MRPSFSSASQIEPALQAVILARDRWGESRATNSLRLGEKFGVNGSAYAGRDDASIAQSPSRCAETFGKADHLTAQVDAVDPGHRVDDGYPLA